ncbi:ABC transporter substrate-binding protein [Acidocella aromatica]|uniref:Peptide/nickel transport system substrate-binding protein n=1 Tax=Acidocella aromatica TaxID=1303579 RepID=A0A840VNW0_9PROT|nr:peptide/nickel transport system substrate-binding protein [Acidocella aromatica]
MKRLRALALACGLACSAAPAAAQECGTIVIPTGIGISGGADITSFNPLLANSLYNTAAAGMMFQGLIWVSGRTLQIDWSRSLASSITTPDNGQTYDVKLRPWHWSDGVPVTTEDVAYTFSLIKSLGPSYAGYGAGGMPDIVQSFTVISPSEFRVVLKHPVNPQWYIFNGLALLLPLPKHAWSKYTLDEIFQNQSQPGFFQVVDGPLRPERLDIGLDLIMTPNPNWEGPPLHFSRLVWKFVEGDGAALQQVESGDLDLANAPMDLWKAVQNLPGIRLINLPPGLSFHEIQLNLRNTDVAFFRDVRVRQAMADAIDQQEMIALIDHGQGEEIRSPVPPNPPTYLPPAMRAGQYPVEYDPQKALALLQEAGFTRGPDGIMQKNGVRLSFTYLSLSGGAVSAQTTVMLQSYLAKIGIEVKVRQIEFNQLVALLNNPHSDWEAAGLGETVGVYPSGEELFGTGAFANAGGYSDPKMDQLIAESTDKPGLQGLYDYATYASEQQPVIFMPVGSTSILARARVQGVENFVDPAYNYYPDALYCTESAAP